MAIHQITHLDDPRLDPYRALTDIALRSASEPVSGIYIAESAKVISRAIAAGHEPLSILMESRWLERMNDLLGAEVMDSHLDVFIGEPGLLEQLTGYHVHRGALAAMIRPEAKTLNEILEDSRRIVVLENIVDHTNVGAIFRSAAGLGIDAIVITPQCADPLYRRSIRVSMGAVFAMPWTRANDWPATLQQLATQGFHTVALSPSDSSTSLEEFAKQGHQKIAFVLGSEGHGLTPESIDLCQSTVHIPMSRGISSLNVAAASAVVFWAIRASTY
jgi:tRNA G18 (ribose-2'-O)-methylase SpoU